MKSAYRSFYENVYQTYSGLINPSKSEKVMEKEEVGKKGLIKNHQTHSLIIGRLTNWLINNQFTIKNFTESPIKGQTGNKEFLVHLKLSEYFLHDV